MALRGTQRSVPDYHSAASKVTPAREWHEPEKRPRLAVAQEDPLSDAGRKVARITMALLSTIATTLTGMPEDHERSSH